MESRSNDIDGLFELAKHAPADPAPWFEPDMTGVEEPLPPEVPLDGLPKGAAVSVNKWRSARDRGPVDIGLVDLVEDDGYELDSYNKEALNDYEAAYDSYERLAEQHALLYARLRTFQWPWVWAAGVWSAGPLMNNKESSDES